MMKIRLIRDCPVNGTNIALRDLGTYQARKDYFDSFTHKEFSVNTARLGEPIKLKASIRELTPYHYGYIDFGDGYRYYLFITDMAMVTESQTEIRYSVDAYETLSQDQVLGFSKVHFVRAPMETLAEAVEDKWLYGKYLPIDYPEPKGWDTTFAYDSFRKCSFLLTGFSDNLPSGLVGSDPSHSFTMLLNVDSQSDFTRMINGEMFESLYWNDGSYHDFAILPSDIYYACMVPIQVEVPAYSTTVYQKSDAGDYIAIGGFLKDYRSIIINVDELNNLTAVKNLWASPNIRRCVSDARGNVIFECPLGYSYECESAFLDWTATSATIDLTYSSYIRDAQGEKIRQVDSKTVIVPCETVDMFTSSWAEYYYRDRENEKQLRQVQRNENVAKGIISSFQNTGGGGIVGTLVGAAGNMASALGTYAVETVMDPQYQKVYDNSAKDKADPLSFVGNTSAYIGAHNHFGMKEIVPDQASMKKYSDDVRMNGTPCDIILADWNMARGIPESNTVSYTYRGWVDLWVNAPESWIYEIEKRFESGLTFIGVQGLEFGSTPSEGGVE